MEDREQQYAATVLAAFGGTRAFGIVPAADLDRNALTTAFQRLGCEIAWCAGYARITHSLHAPLYDEVADWSQGHSPSPSAMDPRGRRAAWNAVKSLVNRAISNDSAIGETPQRRSVA